jgi:hypothetical protein
MRVAQTLPMSPGERVAAQSPAYAAPLASTACRTASSGAVASASARTPVPGKAVATRARDTTTRSDRRFHLCGAPWVDAVCGTRIVSAMSGSHAGFLPHPASNDRMRLQSGGRGDPGLPGE